MHLLWITENYFPNRGGMAQSCDRIVNGLRHEGVTVDVVHFTRRLDRPRVDVNAGGRTISYPVGDDPSHALNCLWNLIESDENREAFTHVVAFGGTLPVLCAPLYAAWLDLPLVTLFRGNDFDAGILSPKRSDLVRFAIERSRTVCVVSRDKQMKIQALYPDIRPVWIPNGIDLEGWTAIDSDCRRAESWRAEHVEPGRRVLGIFGQIKQKKGGLFFLETLRRSAVIDSFHLLFVGDLGEEVLMWLAENEGVISHSTEPFIDRYELISRYLACDFVVVPSFYDGTPNVLLEAGALGVPFIASSAGGMRDMLVDGTHGFLFHPGDEHGCGRALARAAEAGDDQLKCLGNACRELVHSGFDHRSEARAYLQALRADS